MRAEGDYHGACNEYHGLLAANCRVAKLQVNGSNVALTKAVKTSPYIPVARKQPGKHWLPPPHDRLDSRWLNQHH